MDVLNRYLQAVRFWLPSSQQDDIAAELSEDIRSQIEEREAALGHKLNDDDLEQILKQRGRPLLVAEKYLPQKSLIGPVLFPPYWFVLKLVLLCYLVPWVGVWIGLVVLNPSHRSHHLGIALTGDVYVLWVNALTAFAVVTIVFAVLERAKDKNFLTDWSPRQLPPVRDIEQISRLGSAVELIFGLLFFGIWWLKILWSPTVFDSSGVRVTLAPGMQGFLFAVFLWSFLLLGCANIALSAVNLVRPYWTRFRRGLRASLNFVAAGILLLVAKTHAGLVVSGTSVPPDKAPEISRYLSLSLGMAFLIAAIVCVVVGCGDIWRILSSSRKHTQLNHHLAV